ncbi:MULTISPECIES: hydroxypyruvate isomerase family protein [Sphingobacterium]|uniref:Hydroxypyruvate isomerase family protein n=2 Tax=Sphingobacterium TaxID=28453 RepID=A0ABW5YZA3_9SPHI|nr:MULTISPECIES: TIM barrel protein [Sphingobacterium]MBB2952252.1 hydroxypyruvate isomerase [Sphingobacterium sp. JUb56]MCS3553736.1 hydroxypyruvate isomerase [Sphingobacterium sp. JUb21]MCW2260699.1 hydroxypyruvate isomerase [Sphingobacterium kitahiroshimense]NJI75761.1 TIM barrel protein [Sphingobacterium sp. B16(2022)]QQD13944.1 TIM barrel protein [Sphingobacterium sp. UDSM-2020]
MKRSEFLKNTLLVAGSAVSLNTLAGEQQQKKNKAGAVFNLDYAPHQGMFSATAGKNFVDEIKYMHELGFRSIEDNGMTGRSIDEQKKIGETLASLGMRMGVFVVPKGGNGANTLAAGKQEYIDIFLKGCKESVEVAKRVNAKWVTVVPGDYERNLSIGVQTGNVIEALKRGAEIFEPHGITMVLEPLSDSPDLFLRYSDQTYEICKGVGSPSCKLLYDAYHMQKNEGNLIHKMNECWNEIAYIQVGDNPGRREPTTGEVNYKNVFKWLHEKGFKGVVGMEHGMSKSGKIGEETLVNAYREVDNFLV